MKLSVQSKLLLPILGVLVVLSVGSALLISHQVDTEVRTLYENMLRSTTTGVVKTLSIVRRDYMKFVSDIAHTDSMVQFADTLSNPADATDEEKIRLKQKIINLLVEEAKGSSLYSLLNFTGPDGVVMLSSAEEEIGISLNDREYFARGIKGEANFSSPLIAKGSGKKIIVIAVPVKNSKGQVVGVLSADLLLNVLANDCIGGVKIGRTGHVFIADTHSGLLLAHVDADRVATVNIKNQSYGAEMLSKESGITKGRSSKGEERIYYFSEEPGTGWKCVGSFASSAVDARVGEVSQISIWSMVFTTAAIGLIIWLVSRPILTALNKGVDFAQLVANGKLDSELNVHRNDELGTLADALRTMVSKLKEMIASSQKETENAQEQSRKAQEATKLAEEATARAERAKQEGMMAAADQLEEVVEIISSAATELAAQIEHTDKAANDSAIQMGSAATAMNEMTAAVQEVAKNASEAASLSDGTRSKAYTGTEVVEKSVLRMSEMQQSSEQLRDRMCDLDSHVQSISQIMSVIADIADQTNLLALNAAIEAARAGEAGRGFAVVADEVRKLAEKTMHATQEVASAIKTIQDSSTGSMRSVEETLQQIDEVSLLVRESGTALKEIVTTVESTADQVRIIATASEEQSAAGEEVNQSLNEVSQSAQQIVAGMTESNQAVSDLAAQAQNLAKLIEEMKKG